MFLKELVRFSSQHRTLYCYLILSVWIFLLIGGMYRYVGTQANNRHMRPNYLQKEEIRPRKFEEDCNPVEWIRRGEEGGNLDGWKLQGVLLLTRHGDRGPMAHVRTISSVNCGYENDNLLNKYISFLTNATTGGPSGHSTWSKNGPFHGFPLLPPNPKSCLLGQLTYKGVAQLLHVGEIMRQVYGHHLGLLNKLPSITKPISNTSTTPSSTQEEIVILSTRYRRTFQSAMALMFAFLPADRWMQLTVRESHSLTFCFTDCACPHADHLKKHLATNAHNALNKNPGVSAVLQWIGSILLINPSPNLQPLEIRDAILSLVCHNAPYPCRSKKNKILTDVVATSSTTESPDVINIDQEDGVGHLIQDKLTALNEVGTGEQPMDSGCIEVDHVQSLLSFAHYQSQRELNHGHSKRIGLLRAYGLIRNIVTFMLKIISGDKIKFVHYSGHDWTLQFLSLALGISKLHADTSPFVPYASRLAFEIYKSDMDTQYYFRAVLNGKDVTRNLDICEGGKSLSISRDSRGNRADLCPIENIIRFIHDDYFAGMNATNFKDACASPFVTKSRVDF